MIRGYLRLIVFTAGLLMGVQVPGFIDQYHKRVDAHLAEARLNLSGFQTTADRFFRGDLPALIAHYAASEDPVARSDASSIQAIYDRFRMLQEEMSALEGPWYAAAYHVLFRHNRGIFSETLAQYSYSVPLTPQAIAWGIATGFLISALIEALGLVLWRTLRRPRPAHPRAL